MTGDNNHSFYEIMKREGRPCVDAGVCQVASFDPKAVAQARRHLPHPDDMRLTAERFGVLGNAARLSLLLALQGRELCVCDCAQVLGGSVSAASQHLKELRRLGAITFRASGKMAYYRIADPRWVGVVHEAMALLQPLSTQKTSA